ncbi:glycoside hydrolase family 88 protein [Vibrio sp. SS-MA-C1-2]|uniref:glycoside hydrolase family 88 protein n=1 Tax=Vibrio sp. SS-MA-C1-2 TaxID=2908646 RepID=UPI001F2C98DB|nr:glycoside hydrolase family 88 protein [Vibrio sp. SS-MA-C1-2]UJF17707.1 glycoside hydrolase family 88 protein [Vibrio sp. SS-MA-C1-2]
MSLSIPLPATTYNKLDFQSHLETVIGFTQKNITKIGINNPKIGISDHEWKYCGPSDWVSSFWVGQLWLCYQQTGIEQFKNSANFRKAYFKDMLANPDCHDHDLGFQFSLSCVAGYMLTNDEEYKQMAIDAAHSLYLRFRRIGKYIVAWNDTHILGPEKTQGKTIIDSLQNTALLFWASEQTGSPLLKEAAIAHSETLAKHIVRDDYSTFHSFNFDPLTQQPIKGETFQGYADDSCWARGQSWAIHGFAQTYKYTGDVKFLELAKKLAQFTMDHLKTDPVPIWDYRLPQDEIQYKDSSAGAITAAGFLLIAELCEDDDERHIYEQWGMHLTKGLMDQCDLTGDEKALGLLNQGASFVKRDMCKDMLPYGDYYYLEALLRITGNQRFFW